MTIVAWFSYHRSIQVASVCAYIASALTGAHREGLFLASFIQQPEIQYLVSQGEICFQ